MDKVKKSLVALITIVVTWVLLSYMFFPIKLSASPEVYFAETMTHMMPLKLAITTLFALISVFIYEQKTKVSKTE
ncbi:MAG: hypothetical protein IKB36_03325 [Clostridia bacterium]|nr:hypothetical protein [Clostridia bacterium]